jgi:hypothetical protein
MLELVQQQKKEIETKMSEQQVGLFVGKWQPIFLLHAQCSLSFVEFAQQSQQQQQGSSLGNNEETARLRAELSEAQSELLQQKHTEERLRVSTLRVFGYCLICFV